MIRNKHAYQVRKYMGKALKPYKKYLKFVARINDATDDEHTDYLVSITNTFNKKDRAFVLRGYDKDVDIQMGSEFYSLPANELLGYLFFNDFVYTF